MKSLSDYIDYYNKLDNHLLNEYKSLFERYNKTSNIFYFLYFNNIKLRIFNIEIKDIYFSKTSDDHIYLFNKSSLDEDIISHPINRWRNIPMDKSMYILHGGHKFPIYGKYIKREFLVLGSFPHVETLANLASKDIKLTAKKLRSYLQTDTRKDINRIIDLAQLLTKKID